MKSNWTGRHSVKDLLKQASGYSRAPISGFSVGAVALGGSGAVYLGANLEIAGQSLGFALHAEQSAIANAWRHGERNIVEIAMSAVPCGHCRQFMTELDRSADLNIRLPDGMVFRLDDLLPSAFGPASLGVSAGLLTPQLHDIEMSHKDAVIAAALEAAKLSYVPYSASPSGTALLLSDGRIVSGATAESAAFNPSLPALTHALSALILSGGDYRQIVRAVLVERVGRASQHDLSIILLKGICPVTLEYVVAA